MQYYIFDLEADNLLPNITKIHCLCYCNLQNPQDVISLTSYKDIENWALREDATWIGHNIVNYDVPALEKILGIKVKAKLIDTLPIAWYTEPTGRKKYGLAEYGEEFGVKKPVIEEWSGISDSEQEIIDYYEGLNK